MNSNAITVLSLKSDLAKEMKTISNLVGERNSQKFLSSCIACFQNVKELNTCQPQSLLNAFMEAARVQLYPSNSLGEAYILPYNSKAGVMAQFQIGYKGFVTLFWRAGVASIDSQIVFENDKFEYELGLEPILRHVPAEGDRGKATHAYAIAKIGNEKIFRVMDKEGIMKIKATSKAKDSKFSPWNSNDPEYWMWQKTVIKQLAKLLPKTEVLAKAIELDNVCERGGYIGEKPGEIVDVSFAAETPEEKIDNTNDKRAAMREKKAESKTVEGELVDCPHCAAPAGAQHEKDCPTKNN